MFKTTTEIPYSRGFHITFENGWTVSVQWGYGNYCQNRDKTDPQNPETYQSLTAEIAAWNIAGVWHDFGYDTVKGHCDADEVLRWLTHSASLSQ